MKSSSFISAMLCFVIIAFTGCGTKTYRKWQSMDKKAEKRISVVEKSIRREIPRQARHCAEGFIYIPGGTYTRNPAEIYKTGKEDSTLLWDDPSPMLFTHGPYRQITVPGFYISNHEVTVGEYREFVNWVRDSIALTLLAQIDPGYLTKDGTPNWDRREEIWGNDSVRIRALDALLIDNRYSGYSHKSVNTKKLIHTYESGDQLVSLPVYPDTLCFILEYSFAFNDPMTRHYFWHPKYNNYPVVGVSWQQATAYCAWRTRQVKKALTQQKNSGKAPVVTFRLPTESEWEYAALSYKGSSAYENMNSYSIFPWSGRDIKGTDGKYRANFGQILDQNHFTVKSYMDDGAVYPARVTEYQPSDYGLYDMAGNVAEWTMNAVDTTGIHTGLYTPNPWLDRSSLMVIIDSGAARRSGPDRLSYQATRDSLLNVYHSGVRNILETTRVAHTDDLERARKKIIRRLKMTDSLLNELKGQASVKETKSDFVYSHSPKGKSIEAAYETIADITVDDELHNARVYHSNPGARIVKGGSWATGAAYMQCGAREIFSAHRSSSRIGFRVVMVVENP